ncbi:hypothetical protein EN45_095990 [Penicillium chrysogenum]|uniref:Pc12g12540 protein n=2 Tax=Penicillium chrysogenum species complex TaxID=254878 RepID=B6GYN7_PENRW|nr:uncharacterized protein N7525_001333 [Penicillium rubens]KAJ5843592.1 hypothetical protein N7525_001333 [Penicillium rubens]KAJ5845823.1 hypothetical protein N7534_009492 [Penicillium rubens]KZN85419.1 hypothetical protein EN45_095990 [Penicillium chrysogenum]CAP80881.1 Pc12g12540 [Penicillium rubens Wisconsin 54-1255]
MPVTRSQSQNLTNQRSISAQGNTEVSSRSVEQEQAARGAFIEWLILDYSSNSILKQTNWKSILEDIHRIDGCRQVAFACPVENPQRLWIIIHWRSRTLRNEFRQSDMMTEPMKKVIFSPDSDGPCHEGSYNNEALSIYQVENTVGTFIIDCFSDSSLPSMVYEIWTVYFPIEDVVAISDSRPLYDYPKLVNIFLQPYEEPHPMAAILNQTVAWVSGEVVYKGRRCKRIAWFRTWKSREAEDIYKSTVSWGRKDNGEWKLASNSFVEELNGLGMVGYKAWHAKFKEIQTWM